MEPNNLCAATSCVNVSVCGAAVCTKVVMSQKSSIWATIEWLKKVPIRASASKCQAIQKRVTAVLDFHGCYCIFSIFVFQPDVRMCQSQGLNLGPFP